MQRASPYWDAQVSIIMTTLPPLEVITKTLGGTITPYARSYTPKNHKYKWQWRIWSNVAKEVAQLILPYLHLKIDQAKNLIEFREHLEKWPKGGGKVLPQEECDIRELFRLKQQQLNKRGRNE